MLGMSIWTQNGGFLPFSDLYLFPLHYLFQQPPPPVATTTASLIFSEEKPERENTTIGLGEAICNNPYSFYAIY